MLKIQSILFSFIVVGFVSSCSRTGEVNSDRSTKLFELQFINTGLSGDIIKKEDLEFNEFIEFLSNGTFIKKRVHPDSTSIAKGSYTLMLSEDTHYYDLEYEEVGPLIQNCGSSVKEHITILNDNEIFNGSYLPCDGPGFGYELVY